jgi:hypothetical protein
VLRTDTTVAHRSPAFGLRPDALALAKQPFFKNKFQKVREELPRKEVRTSQTKELII